MMTEPMDPQGQQGEEMPLESAVWTAELGAYEWDIQADRVRWLNDWCAYYDIDACEGERHGERWRALVHPDDRVQARREFEEHLAGRRERYETEYRIRTRGGAWRWIRNRAYVIRSAADGREERMVGACVDVDERKRAELALGRTQRKLEALAAAAPIWMVLTDAEGVIEFVNRSMPCLAHGVLIGRTIAGLFDDPAEAARIEEFRRSVVAGAREQMHTLILEDGRTLATWAQPIIEAGRVIGIAAVTADVSERQNRERELLAAINQEQRRFGRDLHDGLGQELTGIALLIKSVSNRAAKEAPGLVASLEEVLRHVTDAITTTRTVARGVSPVGREQGGLGHALQDLARRWRAANGGDIQCRLQSSDSRELDPMLAEHLYHIAQEALTNAIRHSGAREILIELRRTTGRLVLLVTDNGCGIPSVADRCGGLGLQIMRSRAELAGAKLKVEARGGRGTRVECAYKWPPAGGSSASATAAEVTGEVAGGGRKSHTR
jgi:signal transduction histidine kinase